MPCSQLNSVAVGRNANAYSWQDYLRGKITRGGGRGLEGADAFVRGIAFAKLVAVSCRVSLLPVSKFGIHFETPLVGTRALDCAET